MPPLGRTTVHETTDEEARGRARERVAREVRRTGQAPSDLYDPGELEWAFAGVHEELEELEEVAAQAPAAEAEHRSRVERSRELQAATDRVLAEWDAEEAAERRAKAEAEARKRLGWKRGEQP